MWYFSNLKSMNNPLNNFSREGKKSKLEYYTVIKLSAQVMTLQKLFAPYKRQSLL